MLTPTDQAREALEYGARLLQDIGQCYCKNAYACRKCGGVAKLTAALAALEAGEPPDRDIEWWRKEAFRQQTAAHDARAAALEEAIKAVEETEIVEARSSQSYYCQLGDAAATRAACADAIRALSGSRGGA